MFHIQFFIFVSFISGKKLLIMEFETLESNTTVTAYVKVNFLGLVENYANENLDMERVVFIFAQSGMYPVELKIEHYEDSDVRIGTVTET